MRVVMVLCCALALSSCGIDTQPNAHVFDPSQVPLGLMDTTPPSTTVINQFAPDVATTATSVEFEVYFIRSGILVAVPRRAAVTPSPADLVARLVAGPTPAEVAAGHRSALTSPDLVTHTSESPTMVTVDLARAFNDIPRSDRILALGQITLTLTARDDATLVQYTIADAPIEVPEANGVVTRDPVTRANYVALLQGPSPSPTHAPSTAVALPSAGTATTG